MADTVDERDEEYTSLLRVMVVKHKIQGAQGLLPEIGMRVVACGTHVDSGVATERWDRVTCKRCLGTRKKKARLLLKGE